MPDWEELFKKFYQSKEAADVAAAQIKNINVLGERGVPGFKGLMDYIDENAYRIASQRSAAYRPEGSLARPGGEYTGTQRIIESGSEITESKFTELSEMPEAPDILKIFLGMEENVLQESEYRPTSWTQGEPEQGWRSVKEFSDLEVGSPESYYTGKRIAYEDLPPRHDKRYGDISEKVNLMRKSVASGEYTPEMAVGGSFGMDTFPGLGYQSQVDLGHYTESIGYDPEKEQYYFSVSDVWDFEPERYSELWGAEFEDPEFRTEEKRRSYAQAAFMQAAGKPIGIYDRYYLPESYMTDWFGELDAEDKIIGDMKRTDKGFLGE